MTKRSQFFAPSPDDLLPPHRGHRNAKLSTGPTELVLKLANLLWRLRHASAIESGTFKAHQKRQNIIASMYRDAFEAEDDTRQNHA
jgi:hypothetical protein